ncbi:glycoside hydrolase family 85 protein [Macrolepiota fuliginosa MF-IS2]|uniref:Glycoside hydrolase family 85 protein n=1 Tax=Macrolepiota fuliginosa MF-IS2 TaxID=1400762 RepID=A0A9P5XDI8_9AGAR|nr:glycoside hydrolase family 85 protein [Macrolepiota fuliginosa MF-IS2]
MPTTQLLPTPDLYFTTLDELDAYQTKPLSERPNPGRTTKWTPRKTLAQGSRGKLLVCHDYKGGYVEDPQGFTYTFNYWSLCDTFVYFSHHRVTIPPPGWVNAAHRQGSRMLGVLIFEGGSEAECLRLVVGQLPQSTTGSVVQSTVPSTLPVSPHYAVLLAELAAERGFDGYLLNFECYLQGGPEQTRALAAWISLLQSELIKRVGPHAETVWYDSVIFTGDLAWQDRLNSYNLPFFIPSTSFFSNYTWPTSYPNTTAQYYHSLDPNIVGLASNSKPKTLQDVHMGVDVWGRGSYGGGGFGSYQAIDYIAPDSLGLSVALFAQAWTWETQETNPGFTWDTWWQEERDLWVGSPDPNAVMPLPKNPKAKPDDIPGPFKPFSAFFPRLPPPDPIDVPFHTTFCPGVGRSWFVSGSPVTQFAVGWTDVDKQTAMGDLLWPFPELQWEADNEGTVPNVAVSVNMDDAWNGGTSITLNFTETEVKQDVAFRSFWAPIQTLTLTTQKSYTASIVYKVLPGAESLDLDFALSVRPLQDPTTGTTANAIISPDSITTTDVTNSWAKITIQFTLTDAPPTTVSVDSAIGLVITSVSNDTTIPFALALLLGQINVHATPSSTVDPNTPSILWADYQTITVSTTPSPKEPQPPSGDPHLNATPTTKDLTEITWHPATSLEQVGTITITSPDDPNCAWKPEPPLASEWFPGFVYFNIYAAAPDAAAQIQAQARTEQSVMNFAGNDSVMTWLGTSGADGAVGKGKLEFAFDRTQLPTELAGLTKLRIFVQGVLDTGEILDWAKCAYVDVNYST